MGSNIDCQTVRKDTKKYKKCDPTGLCVDPVCLFISYCVGSQSGRPQSPITLCWTLQKEHVKTHYSGKKNPVSTAVLQNTIAERMT